jgi:hypothetical protein
MSAAEALAPIGTADLGKEAERLLGLPKEPRGGA